MLKRFAIVFSFLSLLVLSSCNDNKVSEMKDTNKTTTDISSTKSQDEETDIIVESGEKVILFFGNSLTAGYQLEEQESFPSLIQAKIDSLGHKYTVVNGGLSGETTAGGLNRIDWILRQQIDIFVLELGPNDMLRGLNLEATEENLRGILNKVKSKFPDIKFIIAGMMAPPNMGEDYGDEFKGIYPKLAEEFDAGLIPFLLDGVAGDVELNLQDRMHPNALGYRIVADNVWKVLEGYL